MLGHKAQVAGRPLAFMDENGPKPPRDERRLRRRSDGRIAGHVAQLGFEWSMMRRVGAPSDVRPSGPDTTCR